MCSGFCSFPSHIMRLHQHPLITLYGHLRHRGAKGVSANHTPVATEAGLRSLGLRDSYALYATWQRT